uniref:V-type proton ATPase subunit a n=1 Tax=Panagrellus redivivus TaxID=6233 RepID=A0A7E4VNF5_PANRE
MGLLSELTSMVINHPSMLGAVAYMIFMMNYSGLLIVQAGYWFIETYCLEHLEPSAFLNNPDARVYKLGF